MKSLRSDQRGVAAIIIVTVIITVVTLITLSFVGVVRRNQRQALDQQLSAQAKYAAETEINKKIAQYRTDPSSIDSNGTCEDQGETFNPGSSEIQTTCVLIESAPGPLEYDEVTADNSTIIWLDPADYDLDKLVISWQNTASAAGNVCATEGYGYLPQQIGDFGSPHTIGMLRFDLFRVGPEGDNFSRDSLQNSQLGGVLFPRSGGNDEVSYPTNTSTLPSTQPVIFGDCTGGSPGDYPSYVADEEPHRAYAVIDIPSTYEDSRFILRLRSIYRGHQVKVLGFDTNDDIVHFDDSQLVIEATARVNDVVQRVQVRVPASTPPEELLPDDAIHVTNGGLCKLLETEPGNTVDRC